MNTRTLSTQVEAGLAEAIIAQTPDAIIFADREGSIPLWNRGAEVLFGFPAAEVIGSSLDVMIGSVAVGRDGSDRCAAERAMRERLAELERSTS